MKTYKHVREKNTEQNSSSFVLGYFTNYFKPSAYVTSVHEIDLDALKEQGIKLIICDLDNTLVPHFTKFPTNQVRKFVDEVKKRNFEFVIVSNNTNKRVSFFVEKLGVSNYIANAKKPFPGAIKKTINSFNVTPQETVIIGDMIITDTLAANFVHTESILVQPLMDPEKTVDKILTFLERFVFKRLSKNNLIINSSNIKRSVYSEDYEIL